MCLVPYGGSAVSCWEADTSQTYLSSRRVDPPYLVHWTSPYRARCYEHLLTGR